MAVSIVESARGVVGGIDTHRDVHVAAVVDAAGGVLEETQYVYSEDGALRRVLERAPGEDWQVVYEDE